MEYRKLGRTDITVSIIGIGGEGFETKNYIQCEEIVDCAMAQGINFFDLYNSNPEVRKNVGQALARYPREKYIIEGHLGTTWDKGQYRRTRNIREIKQSYSEFLRYMQIEYVDVGMIHYIDDEKDFFMVFQGEIMEYAKELKGKGIIRALGISTHNPDIALLAVQSGAIDVILFSTNPAYDMLPECVNVNILFEKSTFENRVYKGIDIKRQLLYKRCESEGIALTVMKGYAAGMLLSQSRSPFGRAMTPVQCLHYCLTRPGVASVMVGVFSSGQILDAVAYCKANETEKDYSMVLSQIPQRSFIGHCMYCGHCAPCTVQIDIATINKYLDLATDHDEVPETLINHYNLLAHKAGECIKCGQCMRNCPFGVNVISKMKHATEIFEKQYINKINAG